MSNSAMRFQEPPCPTEVLALGEHRILVFDAVLTPHQVGNFANVVAQLPYEPRASCDGELNVPIDETLFKSAPFLSPIYDDLLRAYSPLLGSAPERVRLEGVYAAAIGPGATPRVHSDDVREESVTFLYYGNRHWKHSWGGETTFYDTDTGLVAGTLPSPGRIVMFNSRLPHRAGLQTVDCPSYRYTVSAFYYPPPQGDG